MNDLFILTRNHRAVNSLSSLYIRKTQFSLLTQLYSKLANFLQNNVHRVRQLVENQDNERIFVLDVLLPEVLITFQKFHYLPFIIIYVSFR